jgi:predicted lactoylglutathione lyase
LYGEYVINGGAQWERNVKMLKLGIAEIEDYRDFIKEEISMKSDNSSEIINFILSKLSREELEETFNKFTQEI